MNDLLVRLAKYKPSEDRIALENFLTELVAYVIHEEPTALREFLALISEELLDSEKWTIETQRSIDGYFIDLLLEAKGHFLIVENKIDASLSKEQLNNYLRISRKYPSGRMALMTKILQPEAVQCSDPLFLRQVRWSELAERWENLGSRNSLNDNRLMDNVLQFMKENGMGPWYNLEVAEIEAPGHFRKLDEKLRDLADEIHRAAVDPFANDPDFTRHPPFLLSGYYGIGWSPTKQGGFPKANFRYFLGFAYGFQPDWLFEHQKEGEAEALIYAVMWPGPEKLDRLRDALRKTCVSLFANGFKLLHSKDMKGLAVTTRRSLRDFPDEVGQRKAIIHFILESHQQITAALPLIYNSFRTIAGN